MPTDDPPLTPAALAPLVALLDIMGPVEAPTLLKQLVEDLSACDRLLVMATQAGDWQALRRASHNLSALAGTAGAEALQHRAEALNRAAHAQDQPAVLLLAERIRADLPTLIALIAALSIQRGTR